MQTGIATDHLNIRATPKIDNPLGENAGNIIGGLHEGAKVEVISSSKDGEWHQINAYPDVTRKDSIVRAWVYAQYIEISQNTSQSPVRIGLNVLNRHEEVALSAAKAGCRYFIILNNPGFATRLKNEYPDADVMVRMYLDKAMPSPDDLIARMEGCQDSRLIYTGLNEADECNQDINGIRRRAAFDRDMARKIAAISGARYAAGAFSMGTPDITDPSVCRVMKEEYAGPFNEGLFDFHGHYYSPNMLFGQTTRGIAGAKMTAQVGKSNTTATWITEQGNTRSMVTSIDPKWFETRWRSFYTDCGFDLTSISRIHCSETGVDEGGVGGFPAHNATNADVLRWGLWFMDEQAKPVLGKPSPFVGGALFQVGNREDWNGYNVEHYYDALTQLWSRKTITPVTRKMAVSDGKYKG